LTVLGLAAAATLILAPDVFFVIFGGLLFGVFLGGSGSWIARHTGLSRGWGITVFALSLVTVAVLGTLLVLPAVLDQADTLAKSLPAAFETIRERLQIHDWLERVVQRAGPGMILSESGGAATAAVTSTFGAIGNLVIALFIGIYGAANPDLYRRGLKALLAPSLRHRADQLIDRSTTKLQGWLLAQLMAMAVVGLLTWLGLWLVGLPLSFLFAVIAALLSFIPNIGPIIALVPAALLASVEGGTTVLLVIGVYLVVQTLESYVITPQIQQDKAAVPPALVIAVQLLFGVLFGLPGLLFATPLTALLMTLVNEVYRSDYLEREVPRAATLAGTARGG
jgi:predicted PurR-regulated permease PerM